MNNIIAKWEDYLLDLTPVQSIGGMWFKRDDLYSPDGVNNGSKFRQLIWLFNERPFPGVSSGAVGGSPQHAMVAACAKHYGMKCVQFTGGKNTDAPSKYESIESAKASGAVIQHVNPGYAGNLNAQAKKFANERGWLHIETNITVEHKVNDPARVEGFHRVGSEQVRNIPSHIENLLIPAGSCNSLTSILYGIARFRPASLKNIILFRIMGNIAKHQRWTNERLDIIRKVTGDALPLPYNFIEHDLIDSGYTSYEDLKEFNYDGLKFHPRYEAKTWCYMKDHLDEFRPYLNDKSLYWIIGSRPHA
jgi:hypothetical protein